MNARNGVIAAGVLGALGVVAGAFGAHALRGSIDARNLEIWQTAARYQQIHAIALLAVSIWAQQDPRPLRRLSITLFTVGIIVFAGTLYPLATGLGPRMLGAITPIGGLCLIGGWVALVIEGLRLRR